LTICYATISGADGLWMDSKGIALGIRYWVLDTGYSLPLQVSGVLPSLCPATADKQVSGVEVLS